MTTLDKQFVVSVRDLRFATMACGHCNTRVTLDLETEIEAPGRSRFAVPRECPRCGSPFDSAIRPAMEALQQAYRALAEFGNAITFTACSGA